MGTFYESWLLADAPVDKNIAEGKIWQKSAVPRRIVRIGLNSTTGINDCAVDILYGSMKVMHLINLASGTASPHMNELFWHSSKLTIPPGIPINIVVTDAPTTSMQMILDIQDLAVR